jgi:hypothetical protein
VNVGLPGVGLGGIFYLLSALLMPVHALVQKARGGTSRRAAFVLRQTALALGIGGALWLTGWLLGLLLAGVSPAAVAGLRPIPTTAAHNVLRVGTLALSLGLLALVLLLVEGARLASRWTSSARVRHATVLELAPRSSDSGIGVDDERVDSGTFGRRR